MREVEQRTGILQQFGACFTDYRKPEWIEHPVQDLLAQKAYALCLGYEDLNDHDQLRADLALAVMVGKADPKGEHRIESRNRGKALAGKSTVRKTGTMHFRENIDRRPDRAKRFQRKPFKPSSRPDSVPFGLKLGDNPILAL